MGSTLRTPPEPSERGSYKGTDQGSRDEETWLGLYHVLEHAFSETIPLPEGTLGELAPSLVEGLAKKAF